jgi:hypothetical protein
MRGESNHLLSFFIRLVSIVKHSIAARLVHRKIKVDLRGRLSVYSALASTDILSYVGIVTVTYLRYHANYGSNVKN